jgi:hypothetical protein
MEDDAMTTFMRRVLGALGLDPAVFEEVEADRSAIGQAIAVVLLGGLGAGVGTAGLGDGAVPVILAVMASAVLGWATWAGLIYYLGTRALADRQTSADLGEVLRTLGFAATPAVFRAFEAVGGLRWVVLPLTSVWMVLAMVVAIRQALDYTSTARAVQLALLGWIVTIGVALVVGVLLARPVS